MASWPFMAERCRVHWMRNALSYVPKAQQSMAAAALRQAFIQPDRATASQTLRHVLGQLRGRSAPGKVSQARGIHRRQRDRRAGTPGLPQPAPHPDPFDQFAGAPEQGGEATRRCRRHTPNEDSIIRLIGAVLLEANDEWQTQNRYMQTEPMAGLMATGTKPKPKPEQISTVAA